MGKFSRWVATLATLTTACGGDQFDMSNSSSAGSSGAAGSAGASPTGGSAGQGGAAGAGGQGEPCATSKKIGTECTGDFKGVCLIPQSHYVCKANFVVCATTKLVNGQWVELPKAEIPGFAEKEICGDGLDNNCNGPIDEGCAGAAGNGGASGKGGKSGNAGASSVGGSAGKSGAAGTPAGGTAGATGGNSGEAGSSGIAGAPQGGTGGSDAGGEAGTSAEGGTDSGGQAGAAGTDSGGTGGTDAAGGTDSTGGTGGTDVGGQSGSAGSDTSGGAAGAPSSCSTDPNASSVGTVCQQGLGVCSQLTYTWVCNDPSVVCEPSADPTTLPTYAAAEICGDSLDNDCNGAVDDGCAPSCLPGAASLEITGGTQLSVLVYFTYSSMYMSYEASSSTSIPLAGNHVPAQIVISTENAAGYQFAGGSQEGTIFGVDITSIPPDMCPVGIHGPDCLGKILSDFRCQVDPASEPGCVSKLVLSSQTIVGQSKTISSPQVLVILNLTCP